MPKYPYRILGTFFDRLFRNGINDNFKDVEMDLKEVQGQVDTLVVKGDSSPAASQARVNANGYVKASLKQRIDDDYKELINLLVGKAPKDLVDSLNAQFNSVLANITNGVESATNSEIVAARNGEASLAARITKITNTLDVVRNGLAFISVRKAYALTKGYIRNDFSIGGNGSDPHYVYTDYIKIDAGTIIDYTMRGASNVYNISFYDKYKNGISGVVTPVANGEIFSGTIQAPANTSYVKFSWQEYGNYGAITYADSNGYFSINFLNEIQGARGEKANLSERLDSMTELLDKVRRGTIAISVLDDFPYSNGYINKSYGITADPNYVHTDYVTIEPGTIIDYSLRGHTLVYSISFYDVNKTPISGQVTSENSANNGQLISGEITAPEDSYYVRFSWGARSNGGTANEITHYDNAVSYEQNTADRVTELEQKVREKTENSINLYEKLTWYIGWLGPDGKIANSSDDHWVYSDFYPVFIGNIDYNIWGHSVIGSINFYDANKGFISTIKAPDGGNTSYRLIGNVEIPENVKFVRFSFGAATFQNYTPILVYNTDLVSEVNTMKTTVTGLQTALGAKNPYEVVTPYKVYTVANDVITSKKGRNRNYAAAIYLDHFFKGLTSEKHIRFNNKLDRLAFYSPIRVTDSNELNPTINWNEGQPVLEKTKTFTITGNDIVDKDFSVIHASTLSSAAAGKTPRVLCIGDSITYAEQATVNDDGHTQNYAYHLMAKELFMKDKIDAGAGHDALFLGQFKKTRTMQYNGQSYEVVTHHEGIRGISLASYLNGTVTAFKSDTTGKFSINAWLSKYRTLNDDGSRLTLGNGTGSLITSGNINNIDVCTPTHVLIMLGANGGGTIDQYRELVNIIKTEYPNMIVALVIPDSAGTYFPSLHPNFDETAALWNTESYLSNRHAAYWDLVKMLQAEYANATSESNNIFFVPFYFVQPTADSMSMRQVNIPGQEFELMEEKNQFNDPYGWGPSVHINGIGHTNWGYQLYSWLKFTAAKGLF